MLISRRNCGLIAGIYPDLSQLVKHSSRSIAGPSDNPCGSERKSHIWFLLINQSIGSTCASYANQTNANRSIYPKSISQWTQRGANRQTNDVAAGRAKIISNPLQARRHRLRPSATSQNLDKSMTPGIRQDSASTNTYSRM